jgi:ATP-binding cassette subfamily B protein RaxB
MLGLENVEFGFKRKLRVVRQTEATECALACLVMIVGVFGYRTDLAILRRRFPSSLRGTTVANIMGIADALDLASRPVKVDIGGLNKLRRPSILHWEMKHFVVLDSVSATGAVIHDPALGRRQLTHAQIAKAFTGIAIEFWPKPEFRAKRERRPITLRRLLGRVSGLYSALGYVLLMSLALEGFSVLSPLYLQWVVDNVLVSADRDLLTTLTMGFSLLLILQAAIGLGRSWLTMEISTRVGVQGRSNVFAHMLRLPVDYFEKRHLGDLASRFRSVEQIQNQLTASFLEAIVDGVMAAVTLIVMSIYSRKLALIAAASTFLYALIRWAWFRALFEATGSQVIQSAKQEGHFLESMRGIRAIKLFQREDQRRQSWLSIFVEQTNANLYTQRLQIGFNFAHTVLVGAEVIVVVWLAARMVLDGAFTAGAIMAFSSYNNQFTTRISGLIDKLFQFRLLGLYSDRVGDIVMSEPEKAMGEQSLGGGANSKELTASIELVGVRFRYSPDDPEVLKGINCVIGEGEAVAITGPSGGGKSTLIGLMMGVRAPTAGDVLIGGVSLRAIGPQNLRAMVGTVLQDDMLFSGTIADNIAFFDSQADREWMEECARRAAIHGDIVAMPMGYNSLIGDMGAVLSGGQRQRILLARAFYKRSQILILDEATSHLDAACEQLINDSIARMKLTRIVVAHRPSTIAAMQRCLTVVDGHIVADVDLGVENRSDGVSAFLDVPAGLSANLA